MKNTRTTLANRPMRTNQESDGLLKVRCNNLSPHKTATAVLGTIPIIVPAKKYRSGTFIDIYKGTLIPLLAVTAFRRRHYTSS